MILHIAWSSIVYSAAYALLFNPKCPQVTEIIPIKSSRGMGLNIRTFSVKVNNWLYVTGLRICRFWLQYRRAGGVTGGMGCTV
jgi:hypothetical protein